MAKKTRIEDIDSEAVINSFRLDDTSIPPEARSTGGNAPSPPPKEELQTVITSPASRPKEEPERKRRNGKPEKQDYDTVFMCGSNVTARLGKQVYIRKETAAERKAVFRSTAFPADKTLIRGSNLDKLADEILGIIKN